ncbi:MAG TPA: hypothetical protein VG941_01725 [Candidatus Paceibacterota bacterium]|nr:hypothetical protein [Candidatus Paceibacterota bacterium]
MDISTSRYNPYEAMSNATQSDNAWDTFDRAFLGLPEPIQDAADSVATMEFLSEIAYIFHLSDAQSEALARTTGYVLMGKLFLGDMVSEITANVGIDADSAKKIANRIAGELFASALEEIKQIQREKFSDRIAGKPTSTQATPSTSSPRLTNPRSKFQYMPRIEPMTPIKPPKPPSATINPNNVVNLRDRNRS